MKAQNEKDGKRENARFMSSIKVGPKGQIVIPKEVREMFGIESGDTLLLLADRERGIALERYGVFDKIADAIFAGKAKEIYPDHNPEDSIQFAEAIKEAGSCEKTVSDETKENSHDKQHGQGQ